MDFDEVWGSEVWEGDSETLNDEYRREMRKNP